MGSRLAPITTFLLVALASAILVDSSYLNYVHKVDALTLHKNTGGGKGGTCSVDGSEGQMMNSSSGGRVLAEAKATYISYDALNKNKVPCDQRGSAYYNCESSGKANPYQRSCTAATKCARH